MRLLVRLQRLLSLILLLGGIIFNIRYRYARFIGMSIVIATGFDNSIIGGQIT